MLIAFVSSRKTHFDSFNSPNDHFQQSTFLTLILNVFMEQLWGQRLFVGGKESESAMFNRRITWQFPVRSTVSCTPSSRRARENDCNSFLLPTIRHEQRIGVDQKRYSIQLAIHYIIIIIIIIKGIYIAQVRKGHKCGL